MKLKSLFLFLALVFGSTYANEVAPVEGPPMTPEFNREGTIFNIRVTIHETHAEVTAAKLKAFPEDGDARVLGWTSWKTATCEIHVARADAYMDKEFTVWGHELAHCLYGNYHKEMDEFLSKEAK